MIFSQFSPSATGGETNVWLDFKNLDESTMQPALQELERLTTTYQIDKKRLILESHNYACLGVFHQHGYYTSYYCPVNDDRYLNTNKHKEEFVNIVREATQSGNIDAVSFPASYYPLVKNAELNVDLLTWHIGNYAWWEFYFNPKLKPLLLDETVKVILVKKHSRYSR